MKSGTLLEIDVETDGITIEDAMKYASRKKVYAESNVIYDPTTEIATSYQWWKFVDRVRGLLVFNDFRYSVSTQRHQSKVKRLLNSLGKPIDIVIKCPAGLGNLDSATTYYNSLIANLTAAINKPKTQKKKNEERKAAIKYFQYKLTEVEYLKGERTSQPRPEYVEQNGLINIDGHKFNKWSLEAIV